MVLKVKDFINLMQVLDPEAYVSADIPERFEERLNLVCAILTGSDYFYFDTVKILERNLFYLNMTTDGNDDNRTVIQTGYQSQQQLEKHDPELYSRICNFLKPKD